MGNRARPAAEPSSGPEWRVVADHPLRTLTAGQGAPVVVFPGFAMRPEVYSPTAAELVRRGRSVVCFDLMSRPGSWDADALETDAAAVLDGMALGPVTMMAHSFGGAIQLGLAAARPDLAGTLVFSDTLALSSGLRLAEQALHIRALARLATAPAARSFARSLISRPGVVAGAAWWAFRSGRSAQVDAVAGHGIPCHVLWAERDTLLSRPEGESFALRLGAQFHVLAGTPRGGPADHDAMFRRPGLFADTLHRIGVL